MRTYQRPTRLKGQQGLQRKRGYVAVGNGKGVSMLLPCAVAQVRSGNAYWRRRFRELCNRFGLGYRLIQGFASREGAGVTTPEQAARITSTYEVWGAPEALAAAMIEPEIYQVEYRCHEASVMFPTRG